MEETRKRRWEDNIKSDLMEVIYENVDYTHLVLMYTDEDDHLLTCKEGLFRVDLLITEPLLYLSLHVD